MFSMNKETMMMVAIAVALFAVFYMYRDVQGVKLELQKLSVPPPPVIQVAPVAPVAPAPVKPSKKKESAGETDE
jgi:hypothetical protein